MMNVRNLKSEKLVGSGTYGEAYRFIDEKGDAISVKKSKPIQPEKPIPSVIIREICLLSEPKYIHIIHAQKVSIQGINSNYSIHFNYEFGAIDVYKLQTKYLNRSPSEIVAKSILFQLLLALNHLHSHGIIHCDLTPSNLIIMPKAYERPGILKLIDFGLSRTAEWKNQEENTFVVTIWYRSPELLLDDKHYTTAVDMWAAGCIFAELLTGEILFRSKAKNENSNEFCDVQMESILRVMGNFRPSDLPQYQSNFLIPFQQLNYRPFQSTFDMKFSNIDQTAKDLLRSMLTLNPANRISAHDALRHPYFNKLPVPVMNITNLFPDSKWAEIESSIWES
ncbi:CMGC family protein kinase [Trichomonas vaginalis G3]|uniref:CMGC family protein kinase n=2 Tax=Trichomonas vaginalis (strain ATCC PRA-98 / G3) TaxID=412133 RepID=A2FHK1_TRIV3|nr:RNA polymerase II CTD heptapeptide repeat kinase protein [Trichomonas vaginalis G3]EAX95636.1 CMGC family protein kinase [Trichomonas vaginalis G3]KAI5487431.1 RNA polymerase II CTD heptapeptide repeat kinase protein [Trichomonas vaginalis G3]|eukprot:XP_001308566.1 CMGC family protein kinase [Trichomonas vaginalis G3]